MNNYLNPYAKALDGLEIGDPVKSFFDFCIERESIRKKREKGLPFPWSTDKIFNNGRFLNVFREDDRGSKAIIKFGNNSNNDLETLIQALFFARWCNKQETLDFISPETLFSPKKLLHLMQKKEQWCNKTAYPVESVHWRKKKYSRIYAATILFFKIGIIPFSFLFNSNFMRPFSFPFYFFFNLIAN